MRIISVRCAPKLLHEEEPSCATGVLQTNGAAALSDAELLAILLRIGNKGKTALDLARDLLTKFGGLQKLLNTE